jgi:amino acid adenylation domain-containing protein/non-ribosomal peptide synthase protein (TIGR01720 family)
MNKSNIESILPLTPLQQGILYHVLESRRPGLYLGQMACDLDGPLDAEIFAVAWQQVVARHAVLRTLFSWERREQPLQIVRAKVELPITIEDWRSLPAAEVTSHWSSVRERAALAKMDLAKAPLVRIVLARTGRERSRLLFAFHHIILDGWSTRLILEDFLDTYAALAANRDAPSRDAPPFETFVNWLAALDHTGSLEFFREMLAGFTVPTVPSFYRESALPEGATHVMRHRLSAQTSAALKEAARRFGITLNTLVVAGWALLLQRYCDTQDVVFGTTFAGRPPELAGAERTAGLFINTLPLRIRAPGDGSGTDWLQDIQRLQARISGVQQTPLVEVQRQAEVEPGTPLFESIVVFENFPRAGEAKLRPLTAAAVDFREFSHYPLALLAVPGNELELIAIGNGARFSAGECEQMLDHLAQLLSGLADARDGNLSRLDVIPAAEQRLLAAAHNVESSTLSPDQAVQDAIASTAVKFPGSIAVQSSSGSLSYAELECASNDIANRLRESGVGPGDYVPLLLGKSAAAIVAMLAVMKTGAAYSPLDASLPADRLRSLIARLHAAAAATPSAEMVIADRDLPPGCHANALRVDRQKPDPNYSAKSQECKITGSDPAYVMFTSGSTGEPKGVIVTHANLCTSTNARGDFYGANPHAFLVLSALSTDSSVAGIYWALFSGGRVVLTAERDEQDLERIREWLVAGEISHLLCVPSLYQVLLQHYEKLGLQSIDVAIVAGERCPQGLVGDHFDCLPGVRLYNEYGPTEATVWATAAELREGETASIGMPVANTLVKVLDSRLRAVPRGITGELCIGGQGVAAGYLGDPQATAQAFVADPAEPKRRLYRTGDRVVARRDGSLTFIGRIDNQLKIRGYRVEPEEIEAALTRINGIAAAAVFVDDGSRLTACLEADDVDTDSVRKVLGDSLPAYMIPQRFSLVGALPRTAAGKIDRARLQQVERIEVTGEQDLKFEAPRNEAEHIVAAAWARVLGMSELSIHDNFFEVGGDSLLSIRILAQLGDNGLRITPEDFFRQPTIAGQAAHANTVVDEASPATVEDGLVPCTPIQHWFEERIGAAVAQWNQCRLYRISKPVSAQDLRLSLQALALRYDAFRLQFSQDNGRLVQQLGNANLNALLAEHTVTSEADIDTIATDMNRTMSLGAAPLIRFALLHLANDTDRLLVCCHHLVIDALSFEFLESDLELALDAQSQGAAPGFRRRVASYSEWSRRLQQSAVALLSAEDADFWVRAATVRHCVLPADMADGKNNEGSAETHRTQLPADLADRLLRQVPAAYRVSARELLLGALYRAFAQQFDTVNLPIDVEGHGRERLFGDLDVSASIGWFTSVFPITFAGAAVGSDEELLQYSKEQLRKAPLNGLSYGLLRSYGDESAAGALRHAPASQVLFNYAAASEAAGESGKWLQFEREHCGECRDPQGARAYLVEVNVIASGPALTVEWRYSHNHHRQETIEALGQRMLSAVDALTDYCLQSTSDGATPDDFPLAKLDADDFDQLKQLLGDDY